MSIHSHQFVESFSGFIGFGMDRRSNENTLRYYLQKFSDDALMTTILNRLSDAEIETLFDMISRLLASHLNETEYHQLFLKEE